MRLKLLVFEFSAPGRNSEINASATPVKDAQPGAPDARGRNDEAGTPKR
jgi:hypothetical protein